VPGPENDVTETEVTAVRSALYRGDRSGAMAIVESGAELNVFDVAALGDTDSLSPMLAADSSAASARSADGFTALHFAAFLGGANAVESLLAAGADPSAVADNEMRVQPLHSAAALGDVEACRLLLAAGADPDARQAGEHTPLHEAALTGNADLVELLLAAGADLAARNDDGRDACSFATENGHLAIAARLRDSSASPVSD
jgi:ankyrin repeat protein